MRSILKVFLAALLGLTALTAEAAHTRANLVLAAGTAQPGHTVLAGIRLRIDPHWHVYWKNPGASGIPTAIKWKLPPGITAGHIEWPVPEKLPPDNLTTYVYQHEVVLLVPLRLAPGLQPGARQLKAHVSWLECYQECVPASADVTATLDIGSATKPSPEADLIQTWQKKLPRSGAKLDAQAWWQKPATSDSRPLILQWNSPAAAAGQADFYPQGSEKFEVEGATKRLPSPDGKIRLLKQVKKYEGAWPTQISGLLIEKSGGRQLAYQATLPISSSGESASASAGVTKAGATAGAASPGGPTPLTQATVPPQPLWRMLLYAFVGGLILNIMPCVLPVIALKILGFVGEARSDPRHIRKLGWFYALGVLVSFLALALLVIGIKAAGHHAGWGIQFGNPYFLIGMTVLVTLIALNLFGVFEVTLGGRVLGAASALSSRQGSAGAFFNGLLATVLATSCTAPFLGAAVGFAFLRPPLMIILIMLVVGAGLAAPYVILSWQPAWLKFLPKPGPWMEKFKVAMGFPMLAAAIWLCSLATTYYGERTWGLAIFLVFMALAAWVFGQFFQRSNRHRGLALAATAVLVYAGYAYALNGQLQWRQPIEGTAAADVSPGEAPGGVAWQPWSRAAVSVAQQNGRPVLVDFTAKWCLTCQKDVKPVLESRAVQKKIKAINAVTLLADYTRFPDNITRELNRYGRAGVPLVLVYPGKPDARAIVLPEFVTQGTVLRALNQATRSQFD